jgi:hypothetical protein
MQVVYIWLVLLAGYGLPTGKSLKMKNSRT